MLRKLATILLISINILLLKGQYTLQNAIDFADQSTLSGQYELAIKEYQRVMYFTDTINPGILLKLGDCYYKAGDHNKAKSFYDRAFFLSDNPDIKSIAVFNKISALIAEKNYSYALIELYNLSDTTFQSYTDEINLLFAICYFGLEDFDKSKNHFIRVVEDSPSTVAKIDSLFTIRKLYMKPNPNRASTLSLILPGIGQFYGGNIKEGLNSFILTESLLALGVYIAYKYTFLDAAFSILPWYQRYYLGGMDKAKELADYKRQQKRGDMYKQILDIISSINPI
ncbi:MAG: tetratricopeptide repeat protein [Bacteroidales bacterium]|nr:tetratricopeptide repeat protein [Bacteroidales bacterium]